MNKEIKQIKTFLLGNKVIELIKEISRDHDIKQGDVIKRAVLLLKIQLNEEKGQA